MTNSLLIIDNMAETCCLVDPMTLDVLCDWVDTRDEIVDQVMMYVDNNPGQRGITWMTYDDWQEARKTK